jgi:protoheme IX farnesyltransferase
MDGRRPATCHETAVKVFHGSISYLTLLFIALAVDPFIGSATLAG